MRSHRFGEVPEQHFENWGEDDGDFLILMAVVSTSPAEIWVAHHSWRQAGQHSGSWLLQVIGEKPSAFGPALHRGERKGHCDLLVELPLKQSNGRAASLPAPPLPTKAV